MSYIGNTPANQNFVAGADQFSGTGSQTVFTLSRNVNTVFDIFVAISNVPQDPYSAYSVSGSTLTFTSAPPSGTGNIYVTYRATNVQTFVPSPGVSAQFGLGSAASPSMTFIGDTNTGIFSPGADTLAFVEGGVEAMRIDSVANVGVGTTSPDSVTNFRFIDVGSSGTNQGIVQVNNGTVKAAIYANGTTGHLATRTNHNLALQTNSTTQANITTAGLFQFNSGYGSVATAYGCRAWVNFNGTGTVAIRASGNVSSITDNGTGDYTVNFTTAMVDANYSIVATGYFPSGSFGFFTNNNASYLTASSARIETVTHTGATASTDFTFSCVAVFR